MKKGELVLLAPIVLLAALLVGWLYAILEGHEVRQRSLQAEKPEVVIDPHDVEALALNIYHESRGLRGENDEGWRSVTAVVFNRLEDRRFPKTIRGVIFEQNAIKGTCAFSWYCDGHSDIPRDSKSFESARVAARRYLLEYQEGRWIDPTRGAHSYHSTRIPANNYFQRLQVFKVVWNEIVGHYFYGDPT